MKTLLIGKDPDAGNDWGQEEKGWQRMRWLGLYSMDMSLSKLWEIVKDREDWRAAVHGVTKSWTQLSDWTTARPTRASNIWPYKRSGLISFLPHLSWQHWLPWCALNTPGTLAMGLWGPSASSGPCSDGIFSRASDHPAQYSTPAPSPIPSPPLSTLLPLYIICSASYCLLPSVKKASREQ